MSERETYLPWSEMLGEYRGYTNDIEALCRDCCENRNDYGDDSARNAGDWRPTRIPPPAELAALERDADRWRKIVELFESGYLPGDCATDLCSGGYLTKTIDAAMKGGEA